MKKQWNMFQTKEDKIPEADLNEIETSGLPGRGASFTSTFIHLAIPNVPIS